MMVAYVQQAPTARATQQPRPPTTPSRSPLSFQSPAAALAPTKSAQRLPDGRARGLVCGRRIAMHGAHA